MARKPRQTAGTTFPLPVTFPAGTGFATEPHARRLAVVRQRTPVESVAAHRGEVG